SNVACKHGGWDCWTVKLDSAANIQWQKCLGGTTWDRGHYIQQTTDGGYVLAGASLSDDGDVSGNHGSWDCWIVKLTENFNTITGKLFMDGNSNGNQDAGEPGLINKRVDELTTGRFSFSQPGGDYDVPVLDSGNFSVSPAPVNYYNPAPGSHSAYFSGINQADSLNDFAFQPTGVYNDLCISISTVSDFISGFNASYIITYENAGTTTLTPSVIFFRDNDVTFVSANPAANTVTPDSAVWNFGPVSPYQTGSILVTVNVSTGTPIGTLINSNVRIEPLAGDANTACNYSAWEIFASGSYDPNEILVSRDTVFTTELPSPPFLEYIIFFQNTGNAVAFNVRVLNNISQKLDINSFEFVASSHPVTIDYSPPSRLMTFTFDNINLPDSNANEPASHGFIRYRIKPLSSLVAGNKIFNKAFIYFDFNAPVNTNFAITEIILPTSISNLSSSSGEGIVISPNPLVSESVITFSNLSNEKFLFTLYDITGRETETVITTDNEIILTKGSKQPGVYLFNLANEKTGERMNGKIVISK
ncbi:MAG: T9SS type A sorting domain-containing protein, partial [Bacteroidota bacterium]